jgi:hypothetical protein
VIWHPGRIRKIILQAWQPIATTRNTTTQHLYLVCSQARHLLSCSTSRLFLDKVFLCCLAGRWQPAALQGLDTRQEDWASLAESRLNHLYAHSGDNKNQAALCSICQIGPMCAPGQYLTIIAGQVGLLQHDVSQTPGEDEPLLHLPVCPDEVVVLEACTPAVKSPRRGN